MAGGNAMDNEEKILMILGDIQKQFNSFHSRLSDLEKSTEEQFKSLDNKFSDSEKNTKDQFKLLEEKMDNRFKLIEECIKNEHDMTRKELKSEVQYVHDEVKEMREDFRAVEQITAKNWRDINNLKSIIS